MSKRPIDADLGLMICGVKDSIELHDVELEDIRNCLDVMHKDIRALERAANQHKVLEAEYRKEMLACAAASQSERHSIRLELSALHKRCDELQRACIGVGKDAQESEVREFGQPISDAPNKAAEDSDRIGDYIGQLWESFEVQRAAIIGDGYQQKPATMNGDFYAGALHALDKLTSYMRGMGK